MPPVSAAECSQWTSAIYQYEQDAAISAGFAIGSVKAEQDYRLLVMDVARTASKQSGVDGELVTWGYGYRLLIEVQSLKAVGSLTLPAIAASVELGQASATLRLEIKGYTGDDLWDLLPVPRPLNVETHGDFVAAAAKIQRAFGKHPDKAVPVKLSACSVQSIAVNGVAAVEVRESVAIAMMLALAADGADQGAAAQAVTTYSDLSVATLDQLAQGLYLLLDPGGSHPSRVEAASALLEPMRQAGWSLPRG